MNTRHINRHTFGAIALAAAAGLLVTACSGGGSHAAPPAAKTQSASQRVPFRIKLGAGSGKASSSKRSPRFISAGTTIIGVAVGGGTGNANASNTGENYYNVSAGSPLCTDNGDGTRTCTVFLTAVPDANIIFAFQLFGDTVSDPTHTITVTPAPAEVLAQASVTSSVIAGQTNTVSVTMQGTPASATISPIGFVAENASVTVPLTIAVFDAAGFEIVTDSGNAQDVYDNSVPVQMALSENRHFGSPVTHVSLTRNSSPISSTVTLTTQQDGQGISLVYDGGASGSYAANAVVAIGAAPHVTSVEADLLAVTLTPDELTLSSGGGPATFSILTPEFIPAANYIIDSSTCPVAVVTSVVDNTNDTFTVTPGNGIGACSVNLNFNGPGVFLPFTASVDVLVM
jgi:hypothetical protein